MGDFQNIIKELRKANGFTQTELADKLNITRSRLAMYESGAREPDFETLEAIADFFNVDIDYLMGRTLKTTQLPQSVHASGGTYYLDPETAALAQELHDNEEYKLLLKASRKLKPEALKALRKYVEMQIEADNHDS